MNPSVRISVIRNGVNSVNRYRMALIESHTPAFLIVLSSTMNGDNRSELIALGGWDLVRRPVALHALAQVVDSCMRLVVEVDGAAGDGVTKVRSSGLDKGTDVR